MTNFQLNLLEGEVPDRDSSSNTQPPIKKRNSNPPVNQLQPLGWILEETLDVSQIGSICGLKLPADWVGLINNLASVDEVRPIAGLNAALRGCAKNIIYIFPYSMSSKAEQRPPYWILTYGSTVDSAFIEDAIREWLEANYGDSQEHFRDIWRRMQLVRSELQWEEIDFRTTPFSVLQAALPELIIRHLTKQGFQLKLTDSSGRIESFNPVVCTSPNNDAYLVTWPPRNHRDENSSVVWQYSYYLRFWVTPRHGKTPPMLLFQPGIRRYVSRPMLRWDNPDNQPLPHAKSILRIPKGCTTVYAAIDELGWACSDAEFSSDRETTLIGLQLNRQGQSVRWMSRIDTILSRIAPQIDFPQPMAFLSNPETFTPLYLLSYGTKLGKHRVGAGVEAADRYELYNRLCGEMPNGLTRPPLINKVFGGGEGSRNILSRKDRRASKHDLEQVEIQPQVYRLQFRTGSPEYLTQLLREVLADVGEIVSSEDEQNTWKFINFQGTTYLIKIDTNLFPNEWYQELNLGGNYNLEAKSAAIQQRARLIEGELSPHRQLNEHAGIIYELPNYRDRKFSRFRKLADPKRAIKWGHALAGWVSQQLTPREDTISEQTSKTSQEKLEEQQKAYQAMCKNAILDVLRQLDFPLGLPFHRHINGSSLPDQIDILGARVLRINARNSRRSKEKSTLIPLLTRIPSDGGSSRIEVCLPSNQGPKWMTYREAELEISRVNQNFPDKFNSDGILAFFRRAIADLSVENPTLLLLDDRNLRQYIPEVLEPQVDAKSLQNLWHQNVLLPNKNHRLLRVAKLRYSSNNDVFHACPTKGFNRYSGIFYEVELSDGYFSVGRDPQSAKVRANARQLDLDRTIKPSWNQSIVEIAWLALQPEDKPEEWALVVHNLRRCSPFLYEDVVTLLPQPLHAAQQLWEYVPRLLLEDEEDDEIEDENNEESITEQFEQLSFL
jgi:hypothetical protein